jgi:hypothetical protein
LLRRAIEGLASQQPDAAPDYSPTLARLLKLSGEGAERIDALANAPALKLTPDEIAGQILRQGAAAGAAAQMELAQAIQALGHTTSVLAKSAQLIRAAQTQRRWIVGAALCGAIAGLLLWSALFGPLLRLMPADWQGPERMAAAIMGRDRWSAGARLMALADTQAWATRQEALRLATENPRALQACRERAVRLKRAVNCHLRIGG